MTENGHAKPVLVTTDWLAEHLGEDGVIVAEVDENPDLYEEGHIPGAVKLHWRDDLQDPVERDIVDKGTFERLLGERGIGNDTTLVALRRQEQLVRGLRVLVREDLRARRRPHPRRRPPEVDRRGPRDHDRRPVAGRRPTQAKERDESIRAYRDQVRAWIGADDRALVDVRSPGRVRRRPDRPARLRAGGRPAGGSHPHRRVDPVGQRRQGRRHVQVRGRAARALRGQGRHRRTSRSPRTAGSASAGPHLVRAAGAARLRRRAQLRRLVDRVGQSRRRADLEVTAFGRREAAKALVATSRAFGAARHACRKPQSRRRGRVRQVGPPSPLFEISSPS